MGREEFTIRVTRKGEILVEMEGLPPRRVKDLMEYFEETIGPGELIEAEGPDASGGVLDEQVARDSSGGEDEEEREAERHRLRRD